MTPVPIVDFGPAPEHWEECSICYDTSEGQNRVGHKPERGPQHTFHADCLSQWILVNNICPICRTPFERKAEIISLTNILIPAVLLERPISNLLDPIFPGISGVYKEHLAFSAKFINEEISLSLLALIVGIESSTASLSVNEIVLGFFLGYLTSEFVRNQNDEDQEVSQNVMSEGSFDRFICSNSFKAAMFASFSLGLAGSSIFVSLSALGIFSSGAILNYGVKKLQETNLISGQTKRTTQKIITLVTSTAAFFMPIKAVSSLILGGAIGAGVQLIKKLSRTASVE